MKCWRNTGSSDTARTLGMTFFLVCLFVCFWLPSFLFTQRQSRIAFLTAWHENEPVLTPLTNPYWWKGGRWTRFRPLPSFILAFSPSRWSSWTGNPSCNLQRMLLGNSLVRFHTKSVSVSYKMRVRSAGKAAPALWWWSALTLAYWRRVAKGFTFSLSKASLTLGYSQSFKATNQSRNHFIIIIIIIICRLYVRSARDLAEVAVAVTQDLPYTGSPEVNTAPAPSHKHFRVRDRRARARSHGICIFVHFRSYYMWLDEKMLQETAGSANINAQRNPGK